MPWGIAAIALGLCFSGTQLLPSQETKTSLWSQHVEPLLKKRCFSCHGGAKKAGELDLRTIDSILKGGSRGTALTPGKPTDSHLFLFVQESIEPHMPPKKQLSKEEIQILKSWIEKMGDPSEMNNQIASDQKQKNTIESKTTIPQGIEPSLVIDLLVQKRWADQKVKAAELCTDEVFVRRVYLDLIGRIPTSAERGQFLQSTHSQKRAKLVNQLIESKEFATHWSELFDAMLMGRKGSKKKASRVQSGWMQFLADGFAKNRPWNQTVSEILLARPKEKSQRGTVWFLYERNNKHQEIAEAIAPAFFGVQIQCAQCHNHPLADEILQEHYWGLVAFFNRGKNSQTKQGIRVAESAIGGFSQFTDLEGRAYDNRLSFLGKPIVDEKRPRGKEKQKDADELYVKTSAGMVPKFSRREKFVKEIVNQNPLIERAFVNRVWAVLMGRGLVHPVDKMDSAHPSSHPELLAWLSRDFAANDFKPQRLIRSIVLSKTYQLSSVPPADNIPEEMFAYGLQKPLSAEALYRSVKVATSGETSTLETDKGIDLLNEMREHFQEVVFVEKNSTLKQTLFLSNHPAIQEVVSVGQSKLTQELAAKNDHSTIHRAFTQLFGRAPTKGELERSQQFLNRPQATREKNAENLLWAMLNSSEFWFNH